MRITTGSPPPRDGQIPILSTSIQPSPAAHADLPHQSAGSDSFRKDFLPLLILLLLKTPENEGMLKGVEGNLWTGRVSWHTSPGAWIRSCFYATNTLPPKIASCGPSWTGACGSRTPSERHSVRLAFDWAARP